VKQRTSYNCIHSSSKIIRQWEENEDNLASSSEVND